MSQLDNVLRRSIAHLDPSDGEGRERVFASAREAMIRLLRVYDPPLTTYEIDSKIREFDFIVGMIERELGWARPRVLAALPDYSAPADREPPPLPAPRRLVAPPPIAPPEPEFDPPPARSEDADYDDDEYYDDYDDVEPEDYDEFDERYDEGLRPTDRLMDLIDSISWRVVAVAVVALLLLGGGTLALLHLRGANATRPAAEVASGPAATPAAPAAPQDAPPPQTSAPQKSAQQTSAQQTSAPPASAPDGNDGLALETLVLFDGRDPSVFQSAPDNPVTFQGDADGGFARISSSTGSTGARVEVGRGVYERIAGHRVRIVLVVRAAHTAPATGLRFAYQNGRVQSPWTDVSVGADYAPVSAVWTAPKDRGGPEYDSVIIEPGLPGDGTAVDIRSVRIEVLS